MAPIIDPPFTHNDVVQKIVDEVANLKNKSLAANKAVKDSKDEAANLATKYKDDITALAGLPIAIEKFSDVDSLFPRCIMPFPSLLFWLETR